MKRRQKKTIILIAVLVIGAIAIFGLNKRFGFLPWGEQNSEFAQGTSSDQSDMYLNPSGATLPSSEPSASQTPQVSPSSNPVSQTPKSILQSVPFFAQAPFGEWDDILFQNACEEASVIMAMHWVAKTSVTKEQAKQEILVLTEFEYKTYGENIDISAEDTIKLFKDYYKYNNVFVRKDIGGAEIKEQLLKGNLVIVPLDGRILKNPFYTPPGPDHHMLVVIGYDGKTNEFITNDVGTRHGEKYRYGFARFEASLIDYPTGNDLPATPGQTAMIVVMPK
ncbi:MAG: hypothetical protein A2Y98_01915 [Candidatus Portnoybacteria bacterium RBG_19FT_COMBO_36_7]|uniref:Peptidase C39-like domain-containing protein n=1 Tax=Candidatus Portnoybacteria bacterium RBG_19FT_COMBO_36_7 TaxID=1801992 RepID=A0A1G2F6K5_9BACT|nr:MAG: hypothetical protein A2Y98_01915 [Candidatus Portnoybacteria bacterium RBG_19FT_COMBO_36_7]